MQNRIESFQKPVSIGIVFKNVSSLDTPAYDMIQGTRRLPAIASSGEAGGHLFWLDVTSLPQTNEKKTPKFNPVPLCLYVSVKRGEKICLSNDYSITDLLKL